jgi:hypothetical protein
MKSLNISKKLQKSIQSKIKIIDDKIKERKKDEDVKDLTKLRETLVDNFKKLNDKRLKIITKKDNYRNYAKKLYNKSKKLLNFIYYFLRVKRALIDRAI